MKLVVNLFILLVISKVFSSVLFKVSSYMLSNILVEVFDMNNKTQISNAITKKLIIIISLMVYS